MKRQKVFFSLFALTFLVSAFSCKFYEYGLDEFLYRKDSVEKRASELKELSGDEVPHGLPDVYDVLLITDLHFGKTYGANGGVHDDGAFIQRIKDIEETERPKFCVCLGDIADHGLEEEYKAYIEAVVNPLSELGIKTYNILGNHDLYNSGWNAFKELMYPYTSFYHFRTKNFSWYFLDSASCSLGSTQMSILRRAMKEDDSPKLVLMHVPVYADGRLYFAMQNTAERNQLISLFSRTGVKASLNGHTHLESENSAAGFPEYVFYDYGGRFYYTIVTVDEKNASVECRSFAFKETEIKK